MPTYDYFCDDCDVEFEELLTQQDEIRDYFDWHPCPSCSGRAERVRVSLVSFNFKGGTPGNSGVHDLDYPVLDKAVGRSANTKWQNYHNRKNERDKIRKESGQTAVSVSGDTVRPTDPVTLENRQKAVNLFNKAKSAPTNKDKI